MLTVSGFELTITLSMPNSRNAIAGVAAAIIEFDALADAIRPAAENDDPLAAFRLGGHFVFVLVRRVVVRRVGFELGGAGIDRLERGDDFSPHSIGAHFHFGRVATAPPIADRKSRIAWPVETAQSLAHRPIIDFDRSSSSSSTICLQLVEKPWIDVASIRESLRRSCRL